MTSLPCHLQLPGPLLALLPLEVLEIGSSVVRVRLGSGQEVDLLDLVRRIAWRARDKRYPRKSIAAALREAVRRREIGLTNMEAEAIGDLAIRVLAASGGRGGLDEEWGTIADAARALTVSVERIRTMLQTAEGRRELGWPWQVDEMEWRIPLAALRSGTRAAYIADLPAEDPYGQGEACDSGSGKP
jgi:hypothetical protein